MTTAGFSNTFRTQANIRPSMILAKSKGFERVLQSTMNKREPENTRHSTSSNRDHLNIKHNRQMNHLLYTSPYSLYLPINSSSAEHSPVDRSKERKVCPPNVSSIYDSHISKDSLLEDSSSDVDETNHKTRKSTSVESSDVDETNYKTRKSTPVKSGGRNNPSVIFDKNNSSAEDMISSDIESSSYSSRTCASSSGSSSYTDSKITVISRCENKPASPFKSNKNKMKSERMRDDKHSSFTDRALISDGKVNFKAENKPVLSVIDSEGEGLHSRIVHWLWRQAKSYKPTFTPFAVDEKKAFIKPADIHRQTHYKETPSEILTSSSDHNLETDDDSDAGEFCWYGEKLVYDTGKSELSDVNQKLEQEFIADSDASEMIWDAYTPVPFLISTRGSGFIPDVKDLDWSDNNDPNISPSTSDEELPKKTVRRKPSRIPRWRAKLDLPGKRQYPAQNVKAMSWRPVDSLEAVKSQETDAVSVPAPLKQKPSSILRELGCAQCVSTPPIIHLKANYEFCNKSQTLESLSTGTQSSIRVP